MSSPLPGRLPALLVPSGVALLHLLLHGVLLLDEAILAGDVERHLSRALAWEATGELPAHGVTIGGTDWSLGVMYYAVIRLGRVFSTDLLDFHFFVLAIEALALFFLVRLACRRFGYLAAGVLGALIVCSAWWAGLMRDGLNPAVAPAGVMVFLYALFGMLETRRAGYAIAVMGSAVVAAQLHASCATLPFAALAILLWQRARLGRRAVAASLAVGGVLSMPVLYAMTGWLDKGGRGVVMARSETASGVLNTLVSAFSPDLASYDSSPAAPVLGAALLALAVAGGVSAWRGRGAHREFDRAVLGVTLAAMALVVVALQWSSGNAYRYLCGAFAPMLVLAFVGIDWLSPTKARTPLLVALLALVAVLAGLRRPVPDPCGLRHQHGVALAADELATRFDATARPRGSLCLTGLTSVGLLFSDRAGANAIVASGGELPPVSPDRVLASVAVRTGSEATLLQVIPVRAAAIERFIDTEAGEARARYEVSAGTRRLSIHVVHGDERPCRLHVDGKPVKTPADRTTSNTYWSPRGNPMTADRVHVDLDGKRTVEVRVGDCLDIVSMEVF